MSISGSTFTHIPNRIHILIDLTRVPHSLFAATIMRVAYGIRISEKNDEYMKMVEDGIAALNRLLSPGKYLVEQLPILRFLPKWMPGAQFRRDAADAKVAARRMCNIPWTRSLEAMVRGFRTLLVFEGLEMLTQICRAAPGSCSTVYDHCNDGAYTYAGGLRS